MNIRLVTWGRKQRAWGDIDKGKNDAMVTWGSYFISTTFKTLGLFNIFPLLLGVYLLALILP
jgi:hypothetical protein